MSQDCYSRRGPEAVNVGNTTPETLSRETGPQEPKTGPTIKSLGGVEGLYDLLKNGTEAEKEKFVDLTQDF